PAARFPLSLHDALPILVIGDPTSAGASPDFPALPGAAAEARAVAQHLRDRGYGKVVELEEGDATPEATLNALYAQPYRILHLAGDRKSTRLNSSHVAIS